MSDSQKDNDLVISTKIKELNTNINIYKEKIQNFLQMINNPPHYDCEGNYVENPDEKKKKPGLCPAELPVCSKKPGQNKGVCTGYNIQEHISEITGVENQISSIIDFLNKNEQEEIIKYNSAENNLNLSHNKLEKIQKEIKENKKKLDKALKQHDDLDGNNSNLELRYNSYYMRYLVWIIIFIITIIITVLCFISPDVISNEIIIVFLFIVCMLLYIGSKYFNIEFRLPRLKGN